MKKLLILISLIFMLSGCYNYRELNDLAIVSGISISKEKNTYKIVVEVINPKKEQDSSSANQPNFTIYKTEGSSLQEALRKVVNESPKKLYGAQIDILLIDEKLAKTDMKSILEFFSRDSEIRSEFYVLVTKNSEVLSVVTPLENLSSKNILESLKSSTDYLGNTNLVTYHDLINYTLNKNVETVLPSIELIGNENEGDGIKNTEETITYSKAKLSNQAIFKNNKLVGYLTFDESLAYNIIMNNSKTPLIKTTYKDNNYVVNEIVSYSSVVKANVKKKKITINIKGKANITELNYDCNLESEKTIKKLQKDLNKRIETLIKDSINSTRLKYNSDIYGFKDLFYKTNPKEYKKIKDNWYKDIYKNLEIEVKSDIEIFEKGNLNGGILHESK